MHEERGDAEYYSKEYRQLRLGWWFIIGFVVVWEGLILSLLATAGLAGWPFLLMPLLFIVRFYRGHRRYVEAREKVFYFVAEGILCPGCLRLRPQGTGPCPRCGALPASRPGGGPASR